MDAASSIAKLGLNARDAFGSMDEVIAFQELINKQFIIGGASVQEQQAAMIQLTQAMASGVLRGEELNSVFEQAPGIIQSIADYLDVSIGEIRLWPQRSTDRRCSAKMPCLRRRMILKPMIFKY